MPLYTQFEGLFAKWVELNYNSTRDVRRGDVPIPGTRLRGSWHSH